MNASKSLRVEEVEVGKRIKALKEKTKLEGLQKEELDIGRELVQLKRSSIIEWFKKLFW